MEPPDLLLTGHPRQQTRLQSIVMDRSRWNSLLVPAKKELETVISRHHQDGADFLDGTAKEIDSGLYYLGDLDNTAVYCVTRDSELIIINAPGGNGFREFLSSRLGSLGLTSTTPTIVLLTSSEANNYSGLESLDPSPLVVVPRGALESMRDVGVENAISDRDFDDITPFPIETIRLEGIRRQSLAYHFAVGSKQVLVTPRVPRNITLFWANRHSGRTTSSPLQPQTRNLISELRESPSGCKGYRDSLNRLNKIRPNIWLPAMPLTGQNANLYDNHWETIIETNRELADSLPQAR
jgi:hypothetical protein